MEKILNNYLKIEPVVYDSFMSQEKSTFEEIGIVLNKDERITDIPIGAKVWFDSFICKKYPTKEDGKFDWFVAYSEIVKVEHE